MTGGPGPHGLSDETQAFVAGVLEDLPALLAVGAPSLASYLRLIPQRWSAPYRCSGRENREPGVRLAAASTDASVEVRCLDPSANRYLLDGAVLALGLAGIERRLRPSPEGHRRSRATGLHAARSTMPGSSHSSPNPTAPPPGCSPSSSGAGPIDTVSVLVADLVTSSVAIPLGRKSAPERIEVLRVVLLMRVRGRPREGRGVPSVVGTTPICPSAVAAPGAGAAGSAPRRGARRCRG